MQSKAEIQGYPHYFAGDDGFIYSLIGWGGSEYYEYPAPKRLTGCPDRKGYLQVHLISNKKSKTVKVHRIVLEAFVGPCPAGMECSHKDGNPANNRLENLEWATFKANNELKAQHGTLQRGESAGMAKLTHDQVVEIVKMRDLGESAKSIAARLGVSDAQVNRIHKGRSWKHLVSCLDRRWNIKRK